MICFQKYPRSVIGVFEDETSQDFEEFSKAAVIHHFEYIDSYYTPFILLSGIHLLLFMFSYVYTIYVFRMIGRSKKHAH